MLDAFASAVFTGLDAMDAAAVPTAAGNRTGLWWYGGHAEPHLKRPRTEPCWTAHLAARLTAAGWPSRSEQSYPGMPKLRCDIVTTLPDGTELWLELKGAWKEWWRQRNQDRVYRSYLIDDAGMGRTHSAQQDIVKLKALPPGRMIGFLLLGFDCSDYPMEPDVAEMAAVTGLADPGWKLWPRLWTDRYEPKERVQAWLWIRPH